MLVLCVLSELDGDLGLLDLLLELLVLDLLPRPSPLGPDLHQVVAVPFQRGDGGGPLGAVKSFVPSSAVF